MDYQKLYLQLFNACTDAIRQLDSCKFLRAKEILVKAQQEAEEYYIEHAE